MTREAVDRLPRTWRAASWLGSWILLVYLAIVLPVDRIVPGFEDWRIVGTCLVLSVALTYWVLAKLVWRAADLERTKNVALLSTTLVCSLLGVDIAYTAYTNMDRDFRLDPEEILAERQIDARVWNSEAVPQLYRPLGERFRLYKPGQRRAAEGFGDHYYPSLLKHELIRTKVLEWRSVEYVIDRYGFRNATLPGSARVYALGDSFAFGYRVSPNAAFPARLGAALGEPVYNMGVQDTSPIEQVLMLEYHLENFPEQFNPCRVVWLNFSGNDLEDSRPPVRGAPPGPPGMREVLDETIIGSIADIPAVLRGQSAVRALLLAEAADSATSGLSSQYKLDGDILAYPLYFSPKLGYSFFYQELLERAAQPKSYVTSHPNLPRVNEAFERMKALSAEHGFGVTVVIIPSAVLLYAEHFEDMPSVEPPHFIHYLEELADRHGFAHLNLYEELAPHAERELLYYRDDVNWNERGHEIAAGIVAEHLQGSAGGACR